MASVRRAAPNSLKRFGPANERSTNVLVPICFEDVRACYHCGKAIQPGSVGFLTVVTSRLKWFGECEKAFHGVCYRIAEQQAAEQLNHKEGPMKLVKELEDSKAESK